MKKTLILAVISLVAIVAWPQAKSEKTVADLKAGIKGETTASANTPHLPTKLPRRVTLPLLNCSLLHQKLNPFMLIIMGKPLHPLVKKWTISSLSLK